MNESNFSLLTQEEIDTLVAFLSNHKLVSNDVLNQNSVDKLIHLVKHNDINRVDLDDIGLKVPKEYDILQELQLRENTSEVCELLFSIDEKTQYLVLTARNTVTGKEKIISPAVLDRRELVETASYWGYSITPILFDKIARIFSLKYSRNTYESIYNLFAEKNFGSADLKVPSFYCPTSNQLLDNLL